MSFFCISCCFFLKNLRPPRSTRTDTLFPYTTLFRSLHLGSLDGAMRAILEHFPVGSIAEGDVFICNDPYLANGSHLPDINIVTPVFWDGALRFFAANIAHPSAVGGAVPGSFAGGLRPVRSDKRRVGKECCSTCRSWWSAG